MATRKYRKLALLTKIELVEGTDSVPTGAANAIQANDVSITPMAGDEETRDLMLPYLGHQGVILTGDYVQMEFSVEIAGAGAAGTVPPFGALLRACALSETINVGVDVVYEPISDGEESVSVYFNQDGVRHVALGARGNVTMDFTPKRIPRFRFTIMGLLGTISDQALPTVDLSGFQTPRPVSKSATTLTLHGAARVGESLSIDLGQQIEPRHLIGAERIQLTDRRATGTAVVEADTLANVDWFAIASARTQAALQLVHGTAAGNIVQIDAPNVEVGRPSQGQTQGVVNYSLPLMLVPNTGNDELTITVK
ncbi:phage tail tube protein [Roseibium porphyridii]|uniref:Phage tail tube protein n=1 Tax=Roseibium porphyridii TaxID=2866279 RepID=A0ABY8F9Y0_9HYPH|nr:phage tail tube protein [Roseibium sp. KMA01]WFE92305.1 phage tail tube protein [Roseibium sp. KMA01]